MPNIEAVRRAKLKYYLKHKLPDEYFLMERRENYNQEDWKPSPRCKDYEISRYGEIYFKGNVEGTLRRKSGICTQHVDKNGYRTAALNYDGIKTREYVHRLVAEAWIPNPENKTEIDHIIPIREGGTDDVDNLRWVTHKENYENTRTKKQMSKTRTGMHHTEESKIKIGNYWRGRKRGPATEEARRKMSEAAKGKKLSEETKAKISKALSNDPRFAKSVIQYDKDWVFIAEYASLKEATETTGACVSSISNCCRGKRNYAGGYRWAYANNKDKMFNN